MKSLLLSILLLTGVSVFAQTGNSTDKNSARSGASAVKATHSPLPYDVNDKYMGRKAEFLNNLTVNELPADFPVYNKSLDLKQYNAIVDEFYRNHPGILKEHVKKKVSGK
ncbi:MAG: hypothetical protein M3R27_06400 [Bacteroidota bacterium]|nr:hypothetical protein [Bacteroidota bacterium]